MPRRPPPTALRLATGPTPRYNLKYVLPSIPLPIFHPLPISRSHFTHASAPRHTIERRQRITHADLPPLDIPFFADGNGSRSGNSSPTSASSTSMKAGSGQILRGPWDHSGSISFDFDVESMLAPLKPAAVSPGTGPGSS
jgi:hypothetical protein